VCKFRHLLERHKLGKKLLSTVNGYLARNGIKISNGTIVDATIISAPSSTKNKDGKRDPEMHQTAKGKQWYFGMKAYVAVDSRHKLIHTVLVSAANVAACLALPHLLRGKETCVWGDQAYQGHSDVIQSVAPRARDCINRRYRWGKRVDEAVKAKNRNKSRVRAKIEHSIGVIKRVFGFQTCAHSPPGCERPASAGWHRPRRRAPAPAGSGAARRDMGTCEELRLLRLHRGDSISRGRSAPLRRGAVLAALVPDGKALDDDHAAAFAAPAEPKLIAPRQALRQEDRVLE